MYRTGLLLCAALSLVSLSALAAAPADSGSDDLAWLFEPATAPQELVIPAEPLDRLTKQPIHSRCTVTANCGGSTITCSVSGTSCSGQDQNCAAGQRGFITCNGTTTWCPVCPCPEGEFRFLEGGCCQGMIKFREQVCQGGVWRNTGYVECSGSCF
ncbi:MAG TPA: hypothetical protein PK413_14435 [Thermoanaerobaculia bacterium]|nr:hypothetical protein [Thermoanaerobaculia bacterium]